MTIMRWLALLLLVGNVMYLGWELDRDTKALVANSRSALTIPAGTTTLKKIDHGADLPELKRVYERYRPRRALLPERR